MARIFSLSLWHHSTFFCFTYLYGPKRFTIIAFFAGCAQCAGNCFFPSEWRTEIGRFYVIEMHHFFLCFCFKTTKYTHVNATSTVDILSSKCVPQAHLFSTSDLRSASLELGYSQCVSLSIFPSFPSIFVLYKSALRIETRSHPSGQVNLTIARRWLQESCG